MWYLMKRCFSCNCYWITTNKITVTVSLSYVNFTKHVRACETAALTLLLFPLLRCRRSNFACSESNLLFVKVLEHLSFFINYSLIIAYRQKKLAQIVFPWDILLTRCPVMKQCSWAQVWLALMGNITLCNVYSSKQAQYEAGLPW